ncbi:MAG: hypothetical protein ABIT16_06075 [Croceibacterium sp.]
MTETISLWKQVLAGAPQRVTRLHDELGQLVPLSRLVRNGPRAVVTGAMRLLFGYRPAKPWISYDAQAILARHLTKASTVLEFGSGMSTAWYAGYSGTVVSIESNDGWFKAVRERLSALGNVDYRFAPDRKAYVDLAPDQLYNLIMIDGSWRDECTAFAIEHLAPGGVIYLDNSDKGFDPMDTGNIPLARSLLMGLAKRDGLPMREFTDFAPTQLFVQRGLMVGG